MPPKPKFTQEEVLQTAFNLLRTQGEASLTARNLGEALDSSSRPLFTLFKNMDELKDALIPLAQAEFETFMSGYRDYIPAFKSYGIRLIQFADQDPHLFSFLFITKQRQAQSLEKWSRAAGAQEAIAILERDYQLDKETATTLFQEMWLHAFSLCVLKTTGTVQLTEQQVSDSLSRTFLGLKNLAQSNQLGILGIVPQRKDSSDNAISEKPVINSSASTQVAAEGEEI